MPITSKTGLLPTVKKKIKNEIEETVTLEMPTLAIPAPFTLRPFTGICNPFPNTCSVLCNHPTNFEAKTLLRRAKDAWITEGKSIIDMDEFLACRGQDKTKHKSDLPNRDNGDLEVPEELFKKYTDIDSRPLTPAPTLASVATKTTQSLRARRCVTPDPTSFIPTKEKTLLVLDLRRSHSQDTFYYQGPQSADSIIEDGAEQEATTLRTTSPSSPNASQSKKKKQKAKPTPTSGRTSSLKSEASKDSDSKSQGPHIPNNRSSSKGSLIQEQEVKERSAPPLSPASSSGGLDCIKRRGKKRKGKKIGKDGTKEGEKEFKGIPDPGETQVSAMESDSKEGSLKDSLTEEDNLVENFSEETAPINIERKTDSEPNISFLKLEILKQFQRQLDQEVVDSELNKKRRIALQEALRCSTNLKRAQPGEEMKNLKKEFQLQIKNSEKWLSIPRVFTRRSSRFELPMDSRLLNEMTPLQYVENYAFASPERLVLYNHVFNLYKEEPEDDESTDRMILGKNIVTGLGDIMGRAMTAEEAKEFQALLDWKNEVGFGFRTFTGISAACERLMASRFSSKTLTQEEDPRHEVERADFETLDGKLSRLNPDKRLVKILKSIRDL